MDGDLLYLAAEINAELRKRKLLLATAESCTGGAIAAAITSVPGSSEIFCGGVVAYSNDVKTNLLGVSSQILAEHGAVSEPTVRMMAEGVRRSMRCHCAIATSGIAGPGGGTSQKPVGTVWIAVDVCGSVTTYMLQADDKGRIANICTAAEKALSLLLQNLRKVK